MIRPGPSAAVALGVLASTREAWAASTSEVENGLFKVLAIAIGLVIVGLVVLVVVVKKSAKSVVDVRREIKNTPELPEARVHQDDTSASTDSTER